MNCCSFLKYGLSNSGASTSRQLSGMLSGFIEESPLDDFALPPTDREEGLDQFGAEFSPVSSSSSARDADAVAFLGDALPLPLPFAILPPSSDWASPPRPRFSQTSSRTQLGHFGSAAVQV